MKKAHYVCVVVNSNGIDKRAKVEKIFFIAGKQTKKKTSK